MQMWHSNPRDLFALRDEIEERVKEAKRRKVVEAKRQADQRRYLRNKKYKNAVKLVSQLREMAYNGPKAIMDGRP